MGYKGQLALYVYYLFSAGALRKLSPPLALMTAQESSLSGGFRAAHQVTPPPHYLHTSHSPFHVLGGVPITPFMLSSTLLRSL